MTAAEPDPKRGRTLPDLLARQVACTPDAVALVAGEEAVSYAELDARSNRLARQLTSLGIGPEDVVGLALARSIELVVSMHAVLKAGAAYLPLDLDYPAERIAFMLADAQPVLLLTVGEVADRLPVGPTPTLRLEPEPVDSAPAPGTDRLASGAEGVRQLHQDHPAYVIYTSGSTGRPKGVVVCHRALVSYLTCAVAAYSSVRGTALVYTPVSFDLTITGLWAPLITGGRVHLATPGGGGRAELRLSPCTFLKVTPSHLPMLELLPIEFLPRDELVLGGEQLMGKVLANWRRRHRAVTVVNEYGPTEAAVGCIAYRIAPGQPLGRGPVPIGKPLPNTHVYLLHDDLSPVGRGQVGELYLAGTGLARGYLGHPDVTAARFLPCPFGPSGTRMYRTGDLVRENSRGQLVFMGRRDDQVKVRGHRVELGEVESVLISHQDVAQAAVVVDLDALGKAYLVAHVVSAHGAEVDPLGLRTFMAATLPEFMVPTEYAMVRRLPLTPAGKVDRVALSTATRAG